MDVNRHFPNEYDEETLRNLEKLIWALIWTYIVILPLMLCYFVTRLILIKERRELMRLERLMDNEIVEAEPDPLGAGDFPGVESLTAAYRRLVDGGAPRVPRGRGRGGRGRYRGRGRR